MKLNCLILVVLTILVFSGCAQPAPTPVAETPTPIPALEPTPTPTPTPTLAPIPEEILTCRFGIVDVRQDFQGIAELSIRWDRLVLVTDIYGKETRTDSSAIKLTDSPVFVEGT